MTSNLIQSREFTEEPDARLQAALAQCWTSQLLLTLGLYSLAFLQAAIKDDLSLFLHDPGEAGWRSLCILIPLYAGMPVLVRLYGSVWFRWLNALLLLLTALVPVAHQTRHILEGKMPDLALTLEAVILSLGILGAVLAVRWARSSP